MSVHELHFRWEWHMQSDAQALWPYVSNTNRFNRETNLPPVKNKDRDGAVPLANARQRLGFVRWGVPVEWEEEPFEWVRPQHFGVLRRYHSGPLETMRVLLELAPHADGGSDLVYQVWAQPRDLFGAIAAQLQIGLLSARAFRRAFRHFDRLALRDAHISHLQATAGASPHRTLFLSNGGLERIRHIRDSMAAAARSRGDSAVLKCLDSLIETISYEDDSAVSHMRPYELADKWRMPRDDVLSLCLHATRADLLILQWQLICPLCRGSKLSASTLSELPSQVHCEACNIDFGANLERSVELTFRPNPALRDVDTRPYCIGGPQVTPHVVVQQLLPPKSQLSLSFPLEAGRYRARALELRGGRWFQAAEKASKRFVLQLSDAGWPDDEPAVDLHAEHLLQNETAQEQLLIIERAAWSDQAVTVADAAMHQRFRDMFPEEVLRPGREIEVGSLTLVFTDLRDSTELYQRLGDAPAFDRVSKHFDDLRAAVSAESGIVVKTIGDAVMAAFREPVHALRAFSSAQRMLAAQTWPLILKVGIHHGPCIAVTMNERLDYFGSTVNIAARIQGISIGGDIVMSDSVWQDVAVQSWWQAAMAEHGLSVTSIQTPLKGFAHEFKVWRIYNSPKA